MIIVTILGLATVAGGIEYFILRPKRFMKNHSGGNYSPLRQVYMNAAERAAQERKQRENNS
jgi:hypothetical protein